MSTSYGTAGNVTVGLAQIFTAPANTVAPTATPATGLFATPASPWLATGFTVQGGQIDVDRKTDSIMVEEQSTPVAILTDSQNITVTLEFSEDTVANMQLAYGGGTVVTTAPATGIAGSSALSLSDTLSQLAVLLLATNSYGLGRSIYIPNVIATGKVSTKYRRAKAARTYPATFTAICPPSAIVVTDITAVA